MITTTYPSLAIVWRRRKRKPLCALVTSCWTREHCSRMTGQQTWWMKFKQDFWYFMRKIEEMYYGTYTIIMWFFFWSYFTWSCIIICDFVQCIGCIVGLTWFKKKLCISLNTIGQFLYCLLKIAYWWQIKKRGWAIKGKINFGVDDYWNKNYWLRYTTWTWGPPYKKSTVGYLNPGSMLGGLKIIP